MLPISVSIEGWFGLSWQQWYDADDLAGLQFLATEVLPLLAVPGRKQG